MPGALQKLSRLTRYPAAAAVALPFLPKPARKALRRFHFRRSIRRSLGGPAPPVLVYATPKVASTAVTHALMPVVGQAVFHVHMIAPENIRALREAMRRRGLTRARHDMNGLEDLAHALREELIKPRRRARVVSLVREPVARNISFYFQTLDVLWKTERAHERFPVERLLAEFHDRFVHERGIDWFDDEFKRVLGVDVYERPFPRELGYQRIDSGPYEILLMRHDLDDRLKEKCLEELVGVSGVRLTPRNVGAEKVYREAYGEFLARVRLPEDYVERLLGSKYARHFFTTEELERARDRWLGRRAPAFR
ncbi:MAG TPA: putative capsular polysaccharide synthesis family protein [Pyrinomonadaceae bacterium]|nr:putative capsular polysaccharide synthesis family protein [Pyrinomonadaceae bacterium]